MEDGKPKPLFWITVAVVVLGLVGYAVYPFIFPKAKEAAVANITKDDLKTIKGSGPEAPDANAPTTVKEYKYVSAEKLPPVQGVSGYSMKDNTVKFAINVWPGWSSLILANNGFDANKVWKTEAGQDFKVQLVLVDDPIVMRDAYASGNVHIGWATLDMLPLMMEDLKRDSRTMPRVFQQVDWSNGGDGMVARNNIVSVSQLRGQTIVLAQNSPSQYFVLNALINGGIQPSEVTFKFTGDAFQAAAAFAADKTIAACVSWSPDIYNLSKVKGNKLIVSTLDANKLIADIWFARADFAKDHSDICEALCRGIFDAAEELDDQAKKQEVAKLMAAGFKLPPADALSMLNDAHLTNYAENREFFMNSNNPTNFERTWDTAYYLYGRIGKVGEKIPWSTVADFSIIQKLGDVPKYAASKNKYQVNFVPKSVASIQAEAGEILTKTVVIHFYPNSSNIKHMITKVKEGKTIEEFYDPNVDFVLEEIGKMTGQFGAARIVIEGHTDGSMKGNVPLEAVKELSAQRAQSVRQSLLSKFPTVSPNQIGADGKGWTKPADSADPNNHAKNRRVEIKVYPLEQQ